VAWRIVVVKELFFFLKKRGELLLQKCIKPTPNRTAILAGYGFSFFLVDEYASNFPSGTCMLSNSGKAWSKSLESLNTRGV